MSALFSLSVETTVFWWLQKDKGRFSHKYIAQIWKDYPPELHKWLLQLTEEFDLTFPLPKEEVNIVPCLLPQEEPKKVLKHGTLVYLNDILWHEHVTSRTLISWNTV